MKGRNEPLAYIPFQKLEVSHYYFQNVTIFILFNAFRNEELKNRIFLLWSHNIWTRVKT